MNNDGMGTPMNIREAHVIDRATGNAILDMDPINLETDVDRDIANAYANDVMDLFEAMVEVELAAPTSDLTLVAVWSDTKEPVRFLSPRCDDLCNLDDGAVEDLANNSCAMVCSECLDD